jgi:predicted ester cyclase
VTGSAAGSGPEARPGESAGGGEQNAALMQCDRAELEAFYRRYLGCCNERRFGELGGFVSQDVEVNGAVRGLRWYAEGLGKFVEAFPDFHWDLRHLLVEGCWLSARLADTGTTPAGRSVRTRELAMYRVVGGRIVEVWGDLDLALLG